MAFVRMGAILKDWPIKLTMLVVPFTLFKIGKFIDDMNQERYRSFYNKSALYGGRDLKPGESLW